MESVLNALTCNLSPKLHLYDNPRVLPCCHRRACNKCILKCLEKSTQQASSYDYHVFNCPYCNLSSKIGLSRDGTECDLERDHVIDAELERNLVDLNHFLIKKVEHSLKSLDERLESTENLLSKRKKFFENEIHEQVCALKAHLDELEVSMVEKLDKSSENMAKNMEIFKMSQHRFLDEIKASAGNLKATAFSYANKYDTDAAKKREKGMGTRRKNLSFNNSLNIKTCQCN